MAKGRSANSSKTKGGRKARGLNFKSKMLLSVAGDVLPVSNDDWVRVAQEYHIRSGELAVREAGKVRRKFTEDLCKGITKQSCGLTTKAQTIYRDILELRNCGNLSNAEEDVVEEEEDEDVNGLVSSLMKQAMMSHMNYMQMMQQQQQLQNKTMMMLFAALLGQRLPAGTALCPHQIFGLLQSEDSPSL